MYDIYKITIESSQADVVMALLGNDCEIEGVSYEEDGFSFYIESHVDPNNVNSVLDRLKSKFQFDYSHKKLEERNWNEEWESSFQPVEVHDYCRLRAQFHAKSSTFKHDIVIHPGMAFGTGHHETTWMMVNALSQMDLNGKKVLDAGCGTGVLAILAALEKAKKVDAFDYDIHSVESIQQNMDLNDCQNIGIHHCQLQDFQGGCYDVIAANINRNVLVSGLPYFKKWLAHLGTIIVSGYLVVDINKIVKVASELDLNLISTEQRGEWVCQTFQ